MSAYTLQLASGTNKTELINLPECMGWLGSVGFSLASTSSITIHECVIIYPTGGAQNWNRRVGGTPEGNWQEWVLAGGRRPWLSCLHENQW